MCRSLLFAVPSSIVSGGAAQKEVIRNCKVRLVHFTSFFVVLVVDINVGE